MSNEKSPTNAALRKEIDELADAMKLEVSHSGLTKPQLIQLREELQAKLDDATKPKSDAPPPAGDGDAGAKPPDSDDAKAEAPPKEDPPPAPPEEPPAPPARAARRADTPVPPAPEVAVRLCVADGCSVTTRRGIMDAGSELERRDFSDDEDDARERVDELVERGILVWR